MTIYLHHTARTRSGFFYALKGHPMEIAYKPCQTPQPYVLPASGLIRLKDVLKVIPVSRATWYKGIQEGRYPPPVRISKRAAAYHVDDIRKLMNR